MAIVLSAAAYQVISGYFGAGITGNYLKIRSKKDNKSIYCYRILPIYRLIFRRMRILYVIMLVLHLIFPLFYAFIFSVLLALSDDINWWSKDRNGLKESVLIMWQESGYSTAVFIFIVIAAEAVLLLINFFLFPVIFDLAVKLFHR